MGDLRKVVGRLGAGGTRAVVDNMVAQDGLDSMEVRSRLGPVSVPVQLQRNPGEQRREIIVDNDVAGILIKMARLRTKRD